MARGWESKSVESQMEEAAEAVEARRAVQGAKLVSEAQLQAQREIDVLEVTRVRVVRDLDATMKPRFQEQLRAALHHLDERLAALRRTV